MSNNLKVLKKLQQARVEWLKEIREKSAKNSHFRNTYFVLKDILPPVTKIFNELGLYSHFNLHKDHGALVIVDLESGEREKYILPIQNIANNFTMQNIGAINTYTKRYLYMNALEIEENEDVIERDNNDETPLVPKEENIKLSKEELVKNLSEVLTEKTLGTLLKQNKKEKLEDFAEEGLEKLWNSYLKNIKK
jgi:peptidyl-prolyl cis-trans isomerase family protein